MKTYDIRIGELHTDLDNPYDPESNKIDVYTSCYWGGKDSKEEYEAKEKFIEGWRLETDLFVANAWCDISGYDYWVVQQ